MRGQESTVLSAQLCWQVVQKEMRPRDLGEQQTTVGTNGSANCVR